MSRATDTKKWVAEQVKTGLKKHLARTFFPTVDQPLRISEIGVHDEIDNLSFHVRVKFQDNEPTRYYRVKIGEST